jgi:predicted membrane-bound spermidine synthase
MQYLFVFFLVSGFCSVLYELVWLRLSMAQFGVTTAMVSIVLSTFMAGLGLGSWGSGYLIRKFENRLAIPALRVYACTELLIGISAILAPYELSWGRVLLEHWSLSSSLSYYLVSGLWIALSLIPWCACMGATIPVAMLHIKRAHATESPRSFSYLYLANVLGAVGGAALPLFFIELYGFHGTLRIGATLNVLLAASAFALSTNQAAADQAAAGSATSSPHASVPVPQLGQSVKPLILLFATGLTTMGMEVVWIRLYTPYLGTAVYAFAAILASYLLATYMGSRLYRQWSVKQNPVPMLIWVLLALSALLPLLATDTRISLNPALRVALGLVVFSSTLGFVTPMLVDRWSNGDPDLAGRAYAINVVGCILGPLFAGFLLLPWIGERWSLIVLSAPWFLMSLYPQWLARDRTALSRIRIKQAIGAGALALGLTIVAATKDYGERFLHHRILRDSTATVTATGEGMNKGLLVNGMGMTTLTPVTKMMSHLPLAFLSHPPRNGLVICFGMGTAFRSMLSWDIPVTTVELVPSVPRMFGYYFADGPALIHSPLAHLVIDDGRRYIERSPEKYDVVVVDPPPPVYAAGSSMLYSKEFLLAIKLRLHPGGILQLWVPGGDATVHSAVAQALKESFPYVRVFRSGEGWGNHFLASDQPIPEWTPEQLVRHMPAKAITDLMEWGPAPTPEKQFAAVLNTESSLDKLIAEAPDAPALQDDRPVNEYILLRSVFPRLAANNQQSVVHASQ